MVEIETELEVWKTYSDFNWIQASNIGNIRTIDHYVKTKNGLRFYKGHVLPQHRSKRGYLCVTFRANGKLFCRRVHRIVAACFLPNPLGLPEVNHIDCNPLNNNISNLEWCTHEQNIDYREKYGTPAKYSTKALRRPVIAVSIKTQETLWFESQMKASRVLGISHQSINKVLIGKRKQTHGYWFTDGKSEISKDKLRKINAGILFRRGLIAVGIATREAYLFSSQKEAGRELGVNSSAINNVLKGRRRQSNGYWFIYIDNHTVENVKDKFGDEIARKAEKLMNKNELV